MHDSEYKLTSDKEYKFSKKDIVDMLEANSKTSQIPYDLVLEFVAIGISVGGKMATNSLTTQLTEQGVRVRGPENVIEASIKELSTSLIEIVGPELDKISGGC